MIQAFLLLVSSLASPFITFNQVDVPESTLYCYAESTTYTTNNTLVVDASACIADKIFNDGFEP